MKSYYECHVTFSHRNLHSILKDKPKEKIEALGWKFSRIEGDIVLGDGAKMYATRHFNAKIPEEEVLVVLLRVAKIIEKLGYKVLRRKIERVIYDDRSSKVRPCNGGCIECHLDDLKTS